VESADTTIDFLRTLNRAEAASAAEEWEDAARWWQRVVASNPVEGRFWSKLAEARYRAKDYRGAISAAQEALALRDGFPSETVYRIACCQALLGGRELALASLEQALALGYRSLDHAASDDDLSSLRDDQRFRELVGLIDRDAFSRDDGWRFDVRFLAREVKRRAFDPFRYTSEQQFDAAVAALAEALPGLTDLQIVVEMDRLLRLLGDGHAGVWPADGSDSFTHQLPVQFWLFEEGIFVIAAAPEHADLLGARVTRFGERAINEVMAVADTLVHRDNENRQWPKFLIPRLLRRLPLLHALDAVPSPTDVELTVQSREGETRTVALQTEPTGPNRRGIRFADDWTFFPNTLSSPLPCYLRNLHASYWFTWLPSERVVYMQFNAVQNDPEESLADFTARLFRFVDEHETDKLVIDIRWNSGGNTFLEMPLLHRLIGSKANQRGKLFVIIGRATYSAAQNLASLIDRHTEAIFVGEPTGSSPTFVGETVEFTLPYSKTSVNVSDLLWQSTWPMDYRIWIAPTLYTPPTFAAFRSNRDPALEAILACQEHMPGW
jgi:tetratricopeptide (TPR) repeat protein